MDPTKSPQDAFVNQPLELPDEDDMPLTDKGNKIMSSMKSQYGAKKGESFFYASRNKGTIKGVEGKGHHSHLGRAENMGAYGPNESKVSDQNAPFRDLHKSGHDLNHTYKTPPAAISPDVKAAGTNHSYLHPHSHSGMREAARTAFDKASRIMPMSKMGTGKT